MISSIFVSELCHAVGEILVIESPVAQGNASKAGAQLFPDVLLEEMGPTFSKISIDMMRLKGRWVVVVEDSIIDLNKSSSMVKLLKKAGAKQVQMRIAYLPINGYCYYGVEVPNREL